MAADASAYAVLGLKPGADWNSVERAYKILIKAHHPDRPGGDSGRAAEINRAYRELRQARSLPAEEGDTWRGPEPLLDYPRRDHRWFAAAVGVTVCAGLLALLAVPAANLVDGYRMRASPVAVIHPLRRPVVRATDPMSEPLNDAAIQQAVAAAARLVRTKDEAPLAEESRKCHALLRARPSLAQLDRCAAFDDAVVQLQDRDPLHDDGPFGQVALTGREMSGASPLSDDYLAIDGRLDRIRLEVELALTPPEPPAPVAATNNLED
ncbi:DnaJ-like protein [Sphingomonas sp. F9_3S_D5_B_2]